MTISEIFIPIESSMTLPELEQILINQNSYYDNLFREISMLSDEAGRVYELFRKISSSGSFRERIKDNNTDEQPYAMILSSIEAFSAELEDDLRETSDRIRSLIQVYQRVHRVILCVMKLPEPYNTVIRRYYFQNEKRSAIAEELHYSEKTITRMKNDALEFILAAVCSGLDDMQILDSEPVFDL